MPQLVLIAALGAGLYAGYRLLSRLGVPDDQVPMPTGDEQRMADTNVEKDMGRLVYDPQTGVYRPAESDRGQH